MKPEDWKSMDNTALYKKVIRAVRNKKMESLLVRIIKDLRRSFSVRSYLSWDMLNNDLRALPANQSIMAISAATEIGERYPALYELALLQSIQNMKSRYIWEPYDEKIIKGSNNLDSFCASIFAGDIGKAMGDFRAFQGEDFAIKGELEEILYFFGTINIEEFTRRKNRNLGQKAVAVEKCINLAAKFPETAPHVYDWMIGYLAAYPVFMPLYDEVVSNMSIDEKWVSNTKSLDEMAFDIIYDALYHQKPIEHILRSMLNDGYSAESMRKAFAMSCLRFMTERSLGSTFYFVNLYNYLHSTHNYYIRYRNKRSLQALFVQGLYVERFFNERGGRGKKIFDHDSITFDDLVAEAIRIDGRQSGGQDLKFVSSLIGERQDTPDWSKELYAKALQKHLDMTEKSYEVEEIYKKIR